MQEPLEIMHRLFAGEKLSFRGEHYTTRDRQAVLPAGRGLPVLMAAGGPKSAEFAGKYADGLITSVKDPADTVAKVIEPYREAAARRGARELVLATRWTVLAGTVSEAWQALSSMRGRLEATDPAELRIKADKMDPHQVHGSYTVLPDAAGLNDAYRPLCTEVGADIVSIQVMSADPMATIEMIEKKGPATTAGRGRLTWHGSGEACLRAKHYPRGTSRATFGFG
jgi:coenzyme F420-dependent glucose-6-phosphate dehydrogenase